MPVLLRLDSSADPAASRTRRLTDAFADAWRSRGDDYIVTARDLHRDRLPHMSSVAQHWPARLRGGMKLDPTIETLQNELVDELMKADALVVGAPMYNYSMPSTLKAWVDLIHIPGVTAPFDVPTQPMSGRPAVIISARGAAYDAGTPQESWDHVTPPLALVLGEGLGMAVHVVTVDRTLAEIVPALDVELAAESLSEATAETVRLARSI